MLYICYDNEGYMNTGVQESGATPFGAVTANSPAGKRLSKKDLPLIMMEHKIPYVATANASYAQDFVQKLRKAITHKGFRYIHLLTPCPPGWRIPADETVHIGKLAVETGAWALYEIEDGIFRLTGPSISLLDQERRKPVEDYLKMQERYKQMTEDDIKLYKQWITDSWKRYAELQKMQ
jgi:pyruvate ferredoxin oxidoreductase beta subunit